MLCALSGLGFSASSPQASQTSVVTAINDRFALGQASANLTSAGVLLHQFDNTEGGDDNMDEHWLPCPTACYHSTPCYCAKVGDRWSASMVNALTPRTAINELILFSKRAGGLIVSPSNTILCSYPQDGATSDRVCDPPGVSASCIPGCFTEVVQNNTPTKCWCDEIAGTPTPWSCPIAPGSTRSSPCAWKPANLTQMMQKQRQVGTYNEVIVSTKEYVAGLPERLEAIFFLATPECHSSNARGAAPHFG